MKLIRSFWIIVCLSVPFAAQAGARQRDVIGAHINYGRGCSTCHVPHTSGVRNPEGSSSDVFMLWGEDVSTTYNADGEMRLYAGIPAESPENRGLLMCVTCHAGNYAQAAMLKNTTYETLPSRFQVSDSVPTFIDEPSDQSGSRLSEHPSGVRVYIRCGGALAWDCIDDQGTLKMEGTQSAKFAANYGFFLKQHTYAHHSVVVCTTCHNPHSMNLTSVSGQSPSQVYPPGVYATKYFLRAPYDQGPRSPRSNQAAQFCRQCHAELSNELNGSTAGTAF